MNQATFIHSKNIYWAPINIYITEIWKRWSYPIKTGITTMGGGGGSQQQEWKI